MKAQTLLTIIPGLAGAMFGLLERIAASDVGPYRGLKNYKTSF